MALYLVVFCLAGSCQLVLPSRSCEPPQHSASLRKANSSDSGQTRGRLVRPEGREHERRNFSGISFNMLKPTPNFVLAASLSMLLGACATYRAEPITPLQTAAALDARTLGDPKLRAFIDAIAPNPAPTASTWNLETLTLAAVYFHPDLDIAYAKLATAEAAIRTARQLPNPSLGLSPQFNVTNANPSAWTVGTAINLLLELFGKRAARTDQAKALAEAGRFDIGTATWQVRGRVRTALIDLWTAQQNVELARGRLELQQQLVGFLERRLAVGEASGLDVARERVNRDQFSLAVQDGQRDAADARAVLATAVGVPLQALDNVELDVSAVTGAVAPPPAAIGLLRKLALTGRSDIASSLRQYEATQAGLRLQVANQYPNVTLGPSYTYDQGDNKFGLNLQADLPIFNQNQGPIAEAAARRRQAAATFMALQAQIIGQIDRAAVAYRTTMQSLRAADALLAEQESRQARTRDLFRAGQIDHVALLAGDLEVANTRLGRLQALVSQRRALGQIEDALQQPIFAPATPTPAPGARAGVQPEPAQ